MKLLAYFDNLVIDTQKLVLIGIVFLTVVYVDFTFIMKAQLLGIKKSAETITQLNKDIAVVSDGLAKMKSAPVKPASAVKKKHLLTDEQVPTLLQEIYFLAGKNKVNIIQVKPVKEVLTQTIDPKKIAQAPKAVPVSITLDIAGNYHYFGAFINDLENSETFISVEEMKLSQSTDNYLQQKASLLLKTYVKL
ncbi:MAG: type 4a pilus biogenesis protein PilO [Candidatus Omnitrophota bacterium]|jgi:Tfp pilus assembly protein PilO